MGVYIETRQVSCAATDLSADASNSRNGNLTLLRSTLKIVTVSQARVAPRKLRTHQKDSMPRLNRLGTLQTRNLRDGFARCRYSIHPFRVLILNPSPKPRREQKTKGNTGEAFRYNTLGVAYMNQQKFAEAQKYFEKALAADPKFSVARLKPGHRAAQPAKARTRSRLSRRSKRACCQMILTPGITLGLVYKDTGETEKAIDAFQHVAQLSPEADAHYFLGYLYSQLQRYDEAIAEFQKALSAFSYHASSEFGIARAFQRKGDSESCAPAPGAL